MNKNSSTSFEPKALDGEHRTAFGRIEQLNEQGQIVSSWVVESQRCSIGSAVECVVRVSGLTALHATVVFGRRNTLIKSAQGDLRVGRRLVREWLVDEPATISLGSHRFVIYPTAYVRASQSFQVAAGSVQDATSRLANAIHPVVQHPSPLAAPVFDEDAQAAFRKSIVDETLSAISNSVTPIQASIAELHDEWRKLADNLNVRETDTKTERDIQRLETQIEALSSSVHDFDSRITQISSDQANSYQTLTQELREQFSSVNSRIVSLQEPKESSIETALLTLHEQIALIQTQLEEQHREHRAFEVRQQDLVEHMRAELDEVSLQSVPTPFVSETQEIAQARTEYTSDNDEQELVDSLDAQSSEHVYDDYLSVPHTNYPHKIHADDEEAVGETYLEDQFAADAPHADHAETYKYTVDSLHNYDDADANAGISEYAAEDEWADESSTSSNSLYQQTYEDESNNAATYQPVDVRYEASDDYASDFLDTEPEAEFDGDSIGEAVSSYNQDQESYEASVPVLDEEVDEAELASYFATELEQEGLVASEFTHEQDHAPIYGDSEADRLNTFSHFTDPLIEDSENVDAMNSVIQDHIDTGLGRQEQEDEVEEESYRTRSALPSWFTEGDDQEIIEPVEDELVASDAIDHMYDSGIEYPEQDDCDEVEAESYYGAIDASGLADDADQVASEVDDDELSAAYTSALYSPPSKSRPTNDADEEVTDEFAGELDDEPVESVVESTVSEVDSGEEEEESVESYMQRLLARVKGAEEPAPAPTTKSMHQVGKTQVINKAPRNEQINQELDNAEELESLDMESFVPRSAAPESNLNLAAMRALANETARTAIEKSKTTKPAPVSNNMSRMITSIVGFVIGTAILLINGITINIAFIGMLAAYLIFLIWGYEATQGIGLISASNSKKSEKAAN